MPLARSPLDPDSSASPTENDRVRRPLLNETSPQETYIESRVYDPSVIIKNGDGDECDKLPRDNKFIVYIIMLLFGIAIMLPWNIFITAGDYFLKYKFNTTESSNATYRSNFIFITGIIGQFTNVAMNFINIAITCGGNPKNRIPYMTILCALVVLFQVVLASIDTSGWPFIFFILCCASVFVMYVATGIMSSCVYYVASMYPMEYVNAIVIGNNLAGIFTTLMSIFSKLVAPDLQIAGIFYFLSSFFVLILAFFGYFAMHRTNFYRYYSQLALANMRKNSRNQEEGEPTTVPYLSIIGKIWIMLFCIFLNFFSMLAIFPVYQFNVQRSDPNFFISDKWYNDILVLLTFNLSVTVGNLLPRLVRKPGAKWISVPVLLRFIFVFAFYAVCNYSDPEATSPNRIIPTLIKNDYVYWTVNMLSPLTFGYLTSLMMMYTPSLVEPQHAGHASMIAVLTIAIGVTAGFNFTKVFAWLVTRS